MQPDDYIPATFAAVGASFFFVVGLMHNGATGALVAFELVAISLCLGLVCGVTALHLVRRDLLSTSGAFRRALFRLAAIATFPAAVALVIPWGIAGLAIALAITWLMLIRFFALRPGEAAAVWALFALLQFLVKYILKSGGILVP